MKLKAITKLILFIIILTSIFYLQYDNSDAQQNQSGGVKAIAWHPSGDALAVTIDENYYPWSVNDEETWLYSHQLDPIAQIMVPVDHRVFRMLWNPSGDKLAMITFGPPFAYEYVLVWDTTDFASPEQIPNFSTEHPAVTDISWVGEDLLAIPAGPIIGIWSIETGEQIQEISTPSEHGITGIAGDRNGILLAAGDNYHVYIIDVTNGDTIYTIPTDVTSDYDLIWNDSGTSIAIASLSHVRIWKQDVNNEYILSNSLDIINNYIYRLDWVGNHVVSSGINTIQIWNSDTGETIGIFSNGDYLSTLALALSPDGKQVAYSNEMGKLQITSLCDFNIPSQAEADLIEALNTANGLEAATSICLSSNSEYLATMSLPIITGDITIEGNGTTLTRDETADLFRFFEVAPSSSQ